VTERVKLRADWLSGVKVESDDAEFNCEAVGVRADIGTSLSNTARKALAPKRAGHGGVRIDCGLEQLTYMFTISLSPAFVKPPN
jgi:hypothetical protein